MELWKEVLPEVRSIVVTGTAGSGKTALCFALLDVAKSVFKDRKIYVFKHPRKDLIEKRGFDNLYSIEQMDRLNGSVVWIDEPQLIWKIQEHKSNEILARLLSIARQRDILLILSTNMTQWVTRMLEGQVDCWVIKDCDYDSVKQGSRVRKIIQQNTLIDASFFRLEVNEYLFYCRKFENYCGKHDFGKPSYFDDEHSKAFKIPNKTPIKSKAKTANKSEVK